MKKFLMMFALMLGFAVSVNAQTALVDNGTAKDNWHIGGGVGTNVWNSVNSWTLFNDNCVDGSHSWWKTQPIKANVMVGKMFNPYVGVEADYAATFNVPHSKTFVDFHNLTGNFVVNMTNVIAGYNGNRRFFELEVLGGAGWIHGFDTDYANVTTSKDAVSVRGALRGNFNLGKKWAITVTPEYLWLPKNFTKMDAYQGVNISVGVKYRFATKRGNFPLRELRSQSEIDELNAKINQLMDANSNLSKANADLAEALKNALAKGDKVVVKTNSVGTLFFEKGKAEVNATEIEKVVKALSETSGSIVLTGTTSPEGSEFVNKKLAFERANSVKKALIDGGIDATRISINNEYTNQRSVVITVQ